MYPNLYDKQDAYRGMYQTRTAEFATEGLTAGMSPASRDARKIALLIVDMQFDFVHPDGTLSVPGSQDDLARLTDFIYRNAGVITSIYPSLDTHSEFQIFFPTWWKYQDTGEHVSPFTMIGLNPRGEAVDLGNQRGLVLPTIDPLWSLKTYLPQLKANAQKDLMVWPYHTIQGTLGHNLMPVLREALTFFAAARLSQINFLVKGTVPQVEHYGIFGPEVLYPKNPNGGINTAILDVLANNDLIYVAGEAKSHCVIETMKQLIAHFKNQPEVIRKIRFLSDCTSSVQHPAVDFDTLANTELAKMASLGVQMVKSTDAIG